MKKATMKKPYEAPAALFIAVSCEDILTASVGDDEMESHRNDAGVNTPLIDLDVGGTLR